VAEVFLNHNQAMQLKIKKLHPDAKIPSYAHPGDAGMDLYALERMEIAPGQRVQIRTGIATEFPTGYVGLFWDKSGLSHKHGLKTLGGVLDAGYRGELMVGMVNLSSETYILEKHHKVCQMLLQPVIFPEVIEADELSDSARGQGGFGSSGK
jgi:dUTP pyrophosphatase